MFAGLFPSISNPLTTFSVLLFFLLLVFGGCGINPDFTAEQQDRDLNARMAWVDKAIQVAERHNLAYRVEVESTGKPSIGETVDLYLNTGISAKVMMFANAAAAPPANDAPPTNDIAPSAIKTTSDSTGDSPNNNSTQSNSIEVATGSPKGDGQ